ncbi:MAG: ubiquitin-like protein UBact [Limisphaerales bacterium]
MPDQKQKQKESAPGNPGGDGAGPSSPSVDKPNVQDLLKKMKKVDPEQAKRYRQRTGQ